jgi:hypothetical protein
MIQISLFFYAPEARELSGDCHERQNAIVAMDLNHRSSHHRPAQAG